MKETTQSKPVDVLKALGLNRASRRKLEALQRRSKRRDRRAKLRKVADAAIADTRKDKDQ